MSLPLMSLFNESLSVSPLKPSHSDRLRSIIHGVIAHRLGTVGAVDTPEEIQEQIRLTRLCIASMRDSPPFTPKEKAILTVAFFAGIIVIGLMMKEKRHLRRVRRHLYNQLDIMVGIQDRRE